MFSGGRAAPGWRGIRLVRWLSIGALVAFSTGWLVPLYLAGQLLFDWCRLEVSPGITGTQRQVNSFSFLETAELQWHLAIGWLVAAVVYGRWLGATGWSGPGQGQRGDRRARCDEPSAS